VPKVQFVNQSASDQDSIASNPARLLNLYPSPVADGESGRTSLLLKSVLGQDAKDDIGTNPVRAMGRGNDKNWLVGDEKLFEISAGGGLTQRGTAIADDINTTIAGNYGIVTVVAGGLYYAWNGSAISQPTTKTFENVGSHCYVGGYTVLTEKNGRRFQWSALGDALSLDALDFASADKVDDDIIRAVEFRGNLLLLKETSTEIWAVDNGAADSTGAFVFTNSTNTGIKSFNLIVRFDDALFFVGNDNRAYLFGQGVVSTTSVETSIAHSKPTHCFYYEDEGHKFCVIRFADRPAWVYDITTRLWHERSEGAGHARWRAIASIRGAGGGGGFSAGFSSGFSVGTNAWYVGNTDGEVLGLSRTNRDLAAPLYRRAISRTIYLGDRKFQISKVELLARMGDHDLKTGATFVLALGDGFALRLDGSSALLVGSLEDGPRDGTVTLWESLDGGRTWRGPKRRSLGRNAEYQRRMIWRARGQAQQYTMRIDLQEPADITLYADGYVTAI
jgi:hypothetical protein